MYEVYLLLANSISVTVYVILSFKFFLMYFHTINISIPLNLIFLFFTTALTDLILKCDFDIAIHHTNIVVPSSQSITIFIRVVISTFVQSE